MAKVLTSTVPGWETEAGEGGAESQSPQEWPGASAHPQRCALCRTSPMVTSSKTVFLILILLVLCPRSFGINEWFINRFRVSIVALISQALRGESELG